MTINFVQRKSFKEKTYKALSVFVGVITILNVSMVGALVKPNIAYAAGYTLEGQRKDLSFTPGNICSGGGTCYAEGENVPFRLTITGLAGSTSYSIRVQHDYKDSAGHDGYVDFNSPGTWDSSATGVALSAPTTSAGLPNTKTYDLTFTTNSGTSTVQLKFNALLGQDAGEWNGAQLHARLVQGVEQESIGNKEVPIQPDKIVIRNLTIQKSDNPDPINLNATTTYTLLVGNTGEQAETVTVVDTLPAQMTYVPGSASLAPTSVVGSVITWSDIALAKTNGSTTITFQAQGISVGTWTNTAAVSATGLTPVTDTENTTVLGQCALTVTKKVNGVTGPVTANQGDTVTYRVDVSNDGTANCTGGGVKITDVVNAQLTYTGETHSTNVLPGYPGPSTAYNASNRTISWNAQVLTPGQSAWVQWTATVQPSACGDFDIPNVANVYADQYNNMQTPIPSNTVHVTGTKICTGTISGKKFNDLDGNGAKDAGEPGLSGWTIQLKNTSDVVLDSTVTDGSGNYSFTPVAGTYRLREVGQGGWLQTTVNPDDIVLAAGQNVTGVNFGNFQKITISGSKFNDLNGNGVWNDGEVALSGWTIQLDKEPFGSVDDTDVTDGSGNYSFTNLGPGTYRLREVNQTGWTQTTTNPLDITATSGTNVPNVNFGNHRDTGTIKVNKLLDNDGNGSYELTNPGSFTWSLDGTGTHAMGTSTAATTIDTHAVNENYDTSLYQFVGWSYGAPEQVNCGEPQYGALPANLTVAKDQTTEITLCNARKTGRLTVHKLLDQDGNPQTPPLEDPQEWFYDIQNGEQHVAMGEGRTLITGTYTVSEDQHPNFTAGDWYCTNSTGVIASGTGEQLTVNLTTAGAECWFSNMRDTGSLKVNKLLDNDGNGSFETVNPGTFVWGLDAATPDRVMGSTLPGLLTATTYDVDENDVPGYHFVGWSYGSPEQVDCSEPEYGGRPASISVTKGNTTEITLCNARDMVEITFDKQIVDPSGNGPANDGDFAFHIAGVDGTFYDGSTVMLPTNTNFNVSETSSYDGLYTLSGASGLCSLPDGIRLSVAEQSGTCVIENTRKTGTVTVHKYFNDDADEAWERIDPQTGWSWDLAPGSQDNLAGATLVLGTGEYTVSEDPIDNYASSWNCSNQTFNVGTSIPVNLGNGQDLVCTFYNVRKTGDLTVIKAVDTDGDGNVNETNATDWTWDLDSGNQNFQTGTTQKVVTGTHAVSEDNKDNFHNLNYVCRNDETGAEVASGTGTSIPEVSVTTDGVTCTFTNVRDTGRVTFDKVVTENPSAETLFEFSVNGSGSYHDGDAVSLPTGSYTVAESAVTGYAFVGASGICSLVEGAIVMNVTTDGGTCTIANRQLSPDLTVTKTDGLTTANPGQTLTYTMVISNVGEFTAANVTVADTLPAQATYVSATLDGVNAPATVTPNPSGDQLAWNIGALANGASKTLLVTVTLDATFPFGTTLLHNAVTVATTTTEPNTGNNSASDDTNVNASPTLGLQKTADPTVVPAGQNVTWTVKWSVSGNSQATSVVIVDPIPGDSTFVSVADGGVYDAATNKITWTLGTKNPGESGEVHFVTKTASPIANGTVITNTATVDSAEIDPAISASASVTVTSAPDLTITKSSDLTTFTNPGKSVNYTVVVTNKSTATDTAKNVVVTDTLPAGFTFAADGTSTKTFAAGDLTPGQSKTFTFLVNISGTQTAGTFVNTATAKGDNTTTVTATTPVEVRVPTVLAATSPDLTIVKEVSKKNLKPGDVTTYTITVTNMGDGDAVNVVVTDTIPSGLSFVHLKGKVATWNLGTLKPGHSRVINVDVRVNSNAKKGTYENVAEVTADDMPAKDAKAAVTVTVPKVLGLATTGVGLLDYLIVLAGLILIGFGIRGLRPQRIPAA